MNNRERSAMQAATPGKECSGFLAMPVCRFGMPHVQASGFCRCQQFPFFAWPGGQKPRSPDGWQFPFFAWPGGQKFCGCDSGTTSTGTTTHPDRINPPTASESINFFISNFQKNFRIMRDFETEQVAQLLRSLFVTNRLETILMEESG